MLGRHGSVPSVFPNARANPRWRKQDGTATERHCCTQCSQSMSIFLLNTCGEWRHPATAEACNHERRFQAEQAETSVRSPTAAVHGTGANTADFSGGNVRDLQPTAGPTDSGRSDRGDAGPEAIKAAWECLLTRLQSTWHRERLQQA